MEEFIKNQKLKLENMSKEEIINEFVIALRCMYKEITKAEHEVKEYKVMKLDTDKKEENLRGLKTALFYFAEIHM